MTKRESFLRDFKNALGWLNPQGESDHPKIASAASYASIMEKADMWLTPRYFDDYREEDFRSLGAEKASELDLLVRQFRTLAAKVPDNGPATQAQHDEGKQLMLKMFGILEGEMKSSE